MNTITKQTLARIISGIFLFTVLLVALAFGQDEHSLREGIATPNVATLGKFGDIPVNLYTGVPSINIPLYEVQSRDLTVPISLSYNSSGIKVDEHAGNVGLGWALSAGGAIMRTVRGLPDDGYSGTGNTGYFENEAEVQSAVTNWHRDNELPGTMANTMINSGSNYDTMPDIFVFNFAGQSGKFVIGVDDTTTNSVTLIPHQQLDISWETGTGSQIVKFVITTASGVKYTFDLIEEVFPQPARRNIRGSTDHSWQTGLYQNGGQYFSAWFLTKVESAQGNDVIQFEYAPVYREVTDVSFYTSTFGENTVDHTIDQTRTRNEFDSYELTKITAGPDTIYFDYNTEDFLKSDGITGNDYELSGRTVSAIRIERNSQELWRWEFTYDYFRSGFTSGKKSPAQADREPKLIAVQQVNTRENITLPPYRFSYLNDDGSLLPYNYDVQDTEGEPKENILWPDYEDNAAIDHWGYYNGKDEYNNPFDGINHRIPHVGTGIDTVENNYNFINRDPDPQYAKYGILNRIDYPTGGYTILEYEGNDYSWDASMEANWSSKSHSYRASSGFSTPFEVLFYTTSSLDIGCQSSGPGSGGIVEIVRLNPDPETVYSHDTEFNLGNDGECRDNQTISNIALAPGEYEVRTTLHDPDPWLLEGTISFSERDIDAFSRTNDPGNGLATIGGGLRIKRIESHPVVSGSKPVIREFQYREFYQGTYTGSSSGVIINPPAYDVQFANWGACINLERRDSESRIPLGTTHGAHIGYREVTELLGEGGREGHIRHVFRSPMELPDYYYPGNLYNSYLRTNLDWARGQEIIREQRDSANVLIRRVTNKYQVDLSPVDYFPGINLKVLSAQCDQGFGPQSATAHFFGGPQIRSGSVRLIKKTTELFEGETTPMATTVDYQYESDETDPGYLQLISQTETNSNGIRRITEYRYAHEKYPEMQTKHMLSQPYSVTVKRDDGTILSKQWTEWSKIDGVWRPRKEWEWAESN